MMNAKRERRTLRGARGRSNNLSGRAACACIAVLLLVLLVGTEQSASALAEQPALVGVEEKVDDRSTAAPEAAASTSSTPATTVATIETTTTTNGSDEASTTAASSPPAGAPSDEPEPVTTTLDSIGVSSDETPAAPPAEMTSSAPEEDEAAAGDETDSVAGIEPKSISRGDGENSLANADSKANLSIENEANDGQRDKEASASSAGRVNMTLVDRIYTEATKDEQATVESWRRMGRKLKKGIGSLTGAVVPMALNMSQEARISSNCSGAMLKWVLSMNQLKSWALRMLDASGKPLAGLLEGSMTMFGNYRQCLKIRAPDEDEIEFTGSFKEYFRGKYCIIQAKPWLPQKARFYNLNTKLQGLMSKEGDDGDDEPNELWYEKTIFDELSEWALAFNFVNIRFDLCVPSLCKREDIQKAINYLLKGVELKARVLRCEMDSPEPPGYSAAAQVETGSPELAEAIAAASTAPAKLNLAELSQLGWLLIPLVAVGLVLIATALSLTISGPDGGQSEHPDAEGKSSVPSSSKLGHTIHSLSLRRSISSHLNVNYDQLADDKPLSLYGVRFLLVLWVILVESAVNLKFEYLRELMMLKDLIFWWPMQFIINSTLQYDSFILLTAFTMGYKMCLDDGINKGRAIIRFVLDKYVRLMPSIMLMVALVILMPLVYRGPVWNDYVTTQSAVCQSTGWVNTIFLQNYLPYNQICLPQTWLLCVEFQLVLLMAPIVYCLNKKYTANYGRGILQDHNDTSRDKKKAVSSRAGDPSKMFFWLWTAPGLILVSSIVISLVVSFYNVYYRELPPSWFYTMADPDSKAMYFGEHMTKVWTHLAVFAIGLLAGVECRRAANNVIRGYKGSNIDYITHHNNSFSPQHKSQSSSAMSLPVILAKNGDNSTNSSPSKYANDINKWQSSVSIDLSNTTNESHEELNCHRSSLVSMSRNGSNMPSSKSNSGRGLCSVLSDITISLLAITTMSLIIFSTHDWSLNDLPKPYIAGLFDAGSRFLWSLAMIWLLYMISIPNEDRSFSILARSLGHPLMVCLGKLSFLIYIIHPFVHTAVLAIQEQPIYSSWLMLFHILIGNITITVILASLVSLFVEMPCRNLFRRCGTSLILARSDMVTGATSLSSNTSATTATSPTTTTATTAATTTNTSTSG